MHKWLYGLLIIMVLSSCQPISADAGRVAHTTSATPNPSTVAPTHCASTEPTWAEPPTDPNADPFGQSYWFVNADRTIWTMLGADGVWHTGGEKVLWIRPDGAVLTVTGQRVDAAAPPLRAQIPCCYPTGFQATGLFFPAPGCWEVVATAAGHSLTFTTWVLPKE